MAPDSDTGRMRAAIDGGLTGEKTNVSDPAAAPMETDAETSGTPTPRRQAEASVATLAEQTRSRPRPDTFGNWQKPGTTHQQRLGLRLLPWFALLAALGVAAGLVGLR